ncbi:MAG: hypothetical protein JNM59_03500 [Hyphomonadaceae bacterium]|nr:hypothetical protein [Hyphomonadaceae bacterium]
MRSLILGLGLSLGLVMACTPPAATPPADTQEASAAPALDAVSEAVLAGLTPTITTEIGAPVQLQATVVNVQDGWAYVVAQPRNPDGSAIDWTTTNLASRYENGVMDTGGGVHALLKNESGTWTVVEHVIAPTDVAWEAWPATHGAPATIFAGPATP